MSYIDEVPVTAGPTMPADVKAITNDGFFPDISMPAMRDAMRLDSTVTDARLRPALVDAILTTNRLLREWQASYLAKGIQKLEEVPALKVDGESQYVAHYRRAVYSFAKADIRELSGLRHYRERADRQEEHGMDGHGAGRAAP